MKNINKFVCMVAAFISILVLSGCGKSVVLQDDMSGYVNGMKLVDLRDAGSYYANGEKMAALYSTAMDTLWNLDTDSSDKVAFVGQKTSWSLKGSYYEQAEKEEDVEAVYIGDMKDEKPDGYGVLFDTDACLKYIGHFKKGRMDGYGVQITLYHGIYVIEYEGEISSGKIANGTTIVPFDLSMVDAHDDGVTVESGNLRTVDALFEKIPDDEVIYYAIRLIPEYIGEVKGEEFEGQGVRYELDGSVWQKGKFRDGYCVSEE